MQYIKVTLSPHWTKHRLTLIKTLECTLLPVSYTSRNLITVFTKHIRMEEAFCNISHILNISNENRQTRSGSTPKIGSVIGRFKHPSRICRWLFDTLCTASGMHIENVLCKVDARLFYTNGAVLPSDAPLTFDTPLTYFISPSMMEL